MVSTATQNRTRRVVGQGFESPRVHALRRCPMALTEEQEKELDEMAKRFKDTKGGK